MATLAGLIIFWLVISAFGLCRVPHNLRAAKDSAHWPRVPGNLLKCELFEKRGGNRRTKYNLEVRYSYRVRGEVFESTNVSFSFGQWSTCRAYYVGLQYFLTKTCELTVYVNPNNPRESVLLPGGYQITRGMLATACVMIVVCPICGFFAIWELFLRPLGVP
jgi:hypothetical protein